jgi:hypothetical protein
MMVLSRERSTSTKVIQTISVTIIHYTEKDNGNHEILCLFLSYFASFERAAGKSLGVTSTHESKSNTTSNRGWEVFYKHPELIQGPRQTEHIFHIPALHW